MNEYWPQQEIFCQRVREFCKVHGYLTKRGAVQLGVLSRLFHVSEDTLRQYLQYKSKRRPDYDRLAHIATVLGVSVTQFTGNPGEAPPSVAQAKWNEASCEDRLFASTVLEDVMADNLSPAEKEELFTAYREAKERILRLRGVFSCCVG